MNKFLNDAYRMDETQCVQNLISQCALSDTSKQNIADRASALIKHIRENQYKKGGIDAFMHEYDLSSEEGIALMCLAESLLRIPDQKTIEHMIEDKLSQGAWDARLGKSESMFVNAATWGLMITGKLMTVSSETSRIQDTLKNVLKRGGSKIVMQAMKILSKQFVMAASIDEGVKRAKTFERQGYRYSYDMLGEAARTADDAEKYFIAYQKAIDCLIKNNKTQDPITAAGISVKLSALSPRYEYNQWEKAINEVYPRLRELALMAAKGNINLTVDAEESSRLDLSLAISEKIIKDPEFNGWHGFGLAVQAYQKRAPYVLDFLIECARTHHKKLMLRLVKGAYWDSEVKDSQVRGLKEYSVFTRKESTDISYMACVKKLFDAKDVIYPQFATHNAYSLAYVLEIAGDFKDFEFQCLHGMGAELYDQIVSDYPCRVYAPVGSHKELLPYLVRRLLENGANTSFVNRLVDARAPIDSLVVDPIDKLQGHSSIPHAKIPLPQSIYGPDRLNSEGIDFSHKTELCNIEAELNQLAPKQWDIPRLKDGESTTIYSPVNTSQKVGSIHFANPQHIEQALSGAHAHQSHWNAVPVHQRAECLKKLAYLLKQHRWPLFSLLNKEAGRTLLDAENEVREAIDFCRYYAMHAEKLMAHPETLVGPTGEHNELQLHGRGVVLTISPWNFPVAIFLGQIVAALVTGNTVIAKPAEQTPLLADYVIQLCYEAGIPKEVLYCLPGAGDVGARCVADPRVCGVMFTGSTQTARLINQTLANRDGAIPFLIAETGGQNAMIVDSTALPEQVVMDAVQSAFGSAGQRCSALRVLFLQNQVADTMITMLKGAMAELVIGNPQLITTDVGPVIDATAKQKLLDHKARMQQEAKLIYECELPAGTQDGHFVAPAVYELEHLNQLPEEIFGPILHVIRYEAKDLDRIIQDINNTGYGLTCGIHTRIEAKADYIQQQIHAGNAYVNRNTIGAVVGVQPFGGEGLSGTGPKAGGPHYLTRLCKERTLTINTTAAGGNASLLAIE